MPLSTINKVQAQSINDLDNYLMAKSLQSTISKDISQNYEKKKCSTATKEEKFSSASKGTPVLNLLNEFKSMQNEEEKSTTPFTENPNNSSTTNTSVSLQVAISNFVLNP